MLFRAVPKSLRAAITVGIGFFITIIGGFPHISDCLPTRA